MSHTESKYPAQDDSAAVFQDSHAAQQISPESSGRTEAKLSGSQIQGNGEATVSAANDRLILDRLLARFLHRGHHCLDGLEVTVRDGCAVLRGVVRSYFERQLAVHLAESLPGIDAVLADIEIVTERYSYNSARTMNRSLAIRPRASWISGPMQLLNFLAIVAGISILTGCGGPTKLPLQPVSARVVLNGQPLPGGTVVLHPTAEKFPEGIRPVGYVAADGTVQFTTYERGDGVPPGEYKVTVTYRPFTTIDDEAVAGENVVPAIYGQTESTTARLTVTAGNSEQKLIALVGSSENIANLPPNPGFDSE